MAFRMEIKTKTPPRRRCRCRSLLLRRSFTDKTSARRAASFLFLSPSFSFPKKKRKNKLFLTVSARLGGIRLSTSVFVKLKGLYSQWRAARRNFSPRSVFLPRFFSPATPVFTAGFPNKSLVPPNMISALVWRRSAAEKSAEKPAARGGLVCAKGMRGGIRGCAASLRNVVNAAEKQ